MKYIMMSDVHKAEEADDALYVVRAKDSEDASSVTLEVFSEADLYRIRKEAPPEADSMVLKDDWVYYDSKNKKLLGRVFGG